MCLQCIDIPVETNRIALERAGRSCILTISGDIDPGLVRFLVRAGGRSIDQFHDLVNHQSGLLGVSETSADLRDLVARQDTDVRAAEAVELFCYRALIAGAAAEFIPQSRTTAVATA